jgi:hypothetical protein
MNPLDSLQNFPDADTLKPELHRLCEKFGVVTQLEVLTSVHEGARQAICFLRLDTLEKELVLMRTLGVGRFGGEVIFVFSLGSSDACQAGGASSQWSPLGNGAIRPASGLNG